VTIRKIRLAPDELMRLVSELRLAAKGEFVSSVMQVAHPTPVRDATEALAAPEAEARQTPESDASREGGPTSRVRESKAPFRPP
jgi:hypothetical protein